VSAAGDPPQACAAGSGERQLAKRDPVGGSASIVRGRCPGLDWKVCCGYSPGACDAFQVGALITLLRTLQASALALCVHGPIQAPAPITDGDDRCPGPS